MVKVIGLYKNSEKSATLNKVHLKAYWADEDGNKIDKGYFGSTIRSVSYTHLTLPTIA